MSFAVPPDETNNRPPEFTTTPSASPPDEIVCVPPWWAVVCRATPSERTPIERTFAELRNTPSSVIPLWYSFPSLSQVNTPRSPRTAPSEEIAAPAPVLSYG